MNNKSETSHELNWLLLARELFSISRSGLTYCKNEYDLHSYRRIQEISAEILAGHSTLSKETVLQAFAMQNGYATPKLDVRGAIVQAGKVLLVQESADGQWAMPGGWADIGDRPSAMVEREVLEESGYIVKARKVVAVYDANRMAPMEFFHSYKIIFLCELLGGKPQTSHETNAVDFFDFENLPPLSGFRTDKNMMNEVFEHVKNPNRPAAFD